MLYIGFAIYNVHALGQRACVLAGQGDVGRQPVRATPPLDHARPSRPCAALFSPHAHISHPRLGHDSHGVSPDLDEEEDAEL